MIWFSAGQSDARAWGCWGCRFSPVWLCHDVADWSIEQNSIVCFDLIKDEPSTLQLCRRYAKPSWECRGLVGIPPTLSQQNAKGSFFVTHTLCVSLGIHSLCQDKLMLLTSPQVLDRAQRPQRLLWSFSHDGQAPHNSRVPHCLRQVEQIASCPGGESSQGAKRAKPSAAPHKPRKMSKFRWIRSTPYTLPPLCLILGGRGSRLFAVWEFEQTKLFACWCIYSECNGPAGGREGYVDLAAKCQTCVAASLLATHELQELFSASPPIMFEIKSWHGYWI